MNELNCKTEGCDEVIGCDDDVTAVTCWRCSMIDIPQLEVEVL